ncbi:hypothetical protein BDV3_000623 [Batrachochytrium dendrobatidis]
MIHGLVKCRARYAARTVSAAGYLPRTSFNRSMVSVPSAGPLVYAGSKYQSWYWSTVAVGLVGAVTAMAFSSIQADNEAAMPLEFKVEPISKLNVPTRITVCHDDQSKDFQLLGLGVRQVTLLYLAVYTAAIYVDDSLTQRISRSTRWTQEFAQDKLVQNTSDSKWFVSDLVNGHPGEISLRIDPVRNTNGPHLRNGFVRFLTERQRQETLKGTLDEKESAAFTKSLDDLRALFPSGAIMKGQVLVFTKLSDGRLHVSFNGREMGSVNSPLLSKWVMEGYLRSDPVISPSLIASVAAGVNHVVQSQ